MASERARFVVLDGMRGAAALVVITDHVPSPLLQSLLPGRYLAVDFFFALSGFVLAHVYDERLNSGLSFGRFMQARVTRLYPLYILATVLGAALALVSTWRGWIHASYLQDGASLLFGAFYAPTPPALSVHPYEPFPYDGPAWSLFFELMVNAVFALIAARLRWRGLAAILVVNAVLLAWTAYAFGRLDSGWIWSNFLGGFPRVGYAFFAGVAVYRLRARWRAPALPAWAAFVALAAIFVAPIPQTWRPACDIAVATLAFPALVATAANAEARGAFMKLCAGMGALSYGFYVLQVPIRDWIDTALPLLLKGDALPGLAHVAVVAGATLAAAAFLHVAYDVPVRRWLARRAAPAQA